MHKYKRVAQVQKNELPSYALRGLVDFERKSSLFDPKTDFIRREGKTEIENDSYSMEKFAELQP